MATNPGVGRRLGNDLQSVDGGLRRSDFRGIHQPTGMKQHHRLCIMQFILSQVDITEDQTSPDQLREAFRGIAADKVSIDSFLMQWRSFINSALSYIAVCDRARLACGASACERS